MLYPQKWAWVLMGESALIFLLVATVNCTNNRGVAVFELCPWCWAREHWGLFTSLFTGPFVSAALPNSWSGNQ